MPLYVVASPIGNLGDISQRAIETLKSVDVVACEDTRHAKILLDRYEIKTKTVSYHQHSRPQKIEYIMDILRQGGDAAIITDAGTPGISDPGGILVSEAVKNKIDVVSIPGPAAFIAALSISGFDISEFVYLGFLPNKKGRQTKLKNIQGEKKTIVLYESVYRIKKLLKELSEYIPEREICVCRELTKKFEEVYRGKPAELTEQIKEKGEFVVVIQNNYNQDNYEK